ncbi:hypothetical protein GN244_ATG11269 [Phytophthora infestans]|uniref:Uncharacterized protein n=1 Tax=Phytophthora infestans TaxID=4787 RepID=A0A833WTF8_PHYIN|nr:hypothetical protein GN244_ATG11269 [Phytophthora infestans]
MVSISFDAETGYRPLANMENGRSFMSFALEKKLKAEQQDTVVKLVGRGKLSVFMQFVDKRKGGDTVAATNRYKQLQPLSLLLVFYVENKTFTSWKGFSSLVAPLRF